MRQKKKYPSKGERYGLWTVVGDEYIVGERYIKHIMCKCVCGTESLVACKNLVWETSKSCGCVSKKHGAWKEKIYSVWIAMISRCYNKKNKCYYLYGGRGITVCDEWKDDFLSFKNFAEKNGYKDGLQVDRINNDLGYTPRNVRFVTSAENSRNKRTNVFHECYGEKKILADWAKDSRCVVSHGLLVSRIYRGRWSMKSAIETPCTNVK